MAIATAIASSKLIVRPEPPNGEDLLVRTCSKALDDSDFVAVFTSTAKSLGEVVDSKECERPHECEIENHGHENAEDVADVVEDSLSLAGKDENDATNQI
jgi:hypothetical protein